VSTRSSLKGCLHTMATLFKQNRYDRLIITCNPAGKYYTLVTPGEVEENVQNVQNREFRVVLNITKGELTSLLKTPQTDLFTTPLSD